MSIWLFYSIFLCQRSSWFLDLLSETSRISRGNSKVSQDCSHLYQLRIESLNKAVLSTPFSVNLAEGVQSEICPWRLKGRVLYESGIMFTRLYRTPRIRRPLLGLKLKIRSLAVPLALDLLETCEQVATAPNCYFPLKCSDPDACFPGEPEITVYAICVVFQMAAVQWV